MERNIWFFGGAGRPASCGGNGCSGAMVLYVGEGLAVWGEFAGRTTNLDYSCCRAAVKVKLRTKPPPTANSSFTMAIGSSVRGAEGGFRSV